MAEKHLLDEPPSPSRRSQPKRLRPSFPSGNPSPSLSASIPSRQMATRPANHRPPHNQKMALAAIARARADRLADPSPDPPLSSKRSRLAPAPEPPAPVPGPSSRSPPDSAPASRPASKHKLPPALARRRSPSVSSAEDFAPPPIASWTPDESRKALQPSQPDSSNPDELRKAKDELERVKKEAASYKDVIDAQTILLDSVRSSLSCNICLEILDSPYALLCGHIFCHKDLYAWFHRKGSEFDSDDGDDQPDFYSDEDSNSEHNHHAHNPLRGHGHGHEQQGQLDEEETDSERASVNRELAEAVQAAPFGRRAGVGANGRAVPSRMTQERRKRNLICPQCRAPVGGRPLPLYAIKEAADRLRAADGPGSASGAEGPLRADVEGHRDERDHSWGGLFPRGAARPQVVLDADDGVRRCGMCAWELDGHGVCEGCGEMYSSDNGSPSYHSSDGPDDSIDLGTMYGTDSDEGPVGFPEHVLAPYAGSVDSDESDMGSDIQPVRVIGRRRLRAPATESDSEGAHSPSEDTSDASWRGHARAHSSGAESAGFSDLADGRPDSGDEDAFPSESEDDDDDEQQDEALELPGSENEDSDDSSIE